MRYTFIFFIAFAFLSCGLAKNSTNMAKNVKKSVRGSWTNDTSGIIKMKFRKSKIYYPWMPASFPYKVVGDTIELTRVDGTYFGPINWSAKAILKNDTLVIFELEGVEKYWRVR